MELYEFLDWMSKHDTQFTMEQLPRSDGHIHLQFHVRYLGQLLKVEKVADSEVRSMAKFDPLVDLLLKMIKEIDAAKKTQENRV